MVEQYEKIRKFWDSQAIQFGDDPLASTPDYIAKRLEIRAFLKHLPSTGNSLDVGCGNGSMTLLLAAERPNMTFTGIDFSEQMVKVARQTLSALDADLRNRVQFHVSNVLALPFPDNTFDCVISDRCLINITNRTDQEQALEEITRVLTPKGTYLMCENTMQGLDKLNQLRQMVDLYKMETRWHNLYLDETALSRICERLSLRVVTVDNFSSLYYIISRVFNAKLAHIAGEEPRYDHPLNEISASLPSVGDYGPLKLFVCTKS